MSAFGTAHGPSKFSRAIMKTMVIAGLLALILLFRSETQAEEKVAAAATSRSEKLSLADWIATQFHPYSTELSIRAVDVRPIPPDGNFAVLSDVAGSSESAIEQDKSTDANQTELEFNGQGFTTQMTLRPGNYEARLRRSDLWLVPPRKMEDVVVYKNVEFSGVFAHLTDLFIEPQKFLQLFNPFAPPGYGVALTTRTGFLLWSFGF
jgi:hypothetical protein